MFEGKQNLILYKFYFFPVEQMISPFTAEEHEPTFKYLLSTTFNF